MLVSLLFTTSKKQFNISVCLKAYFFLNKNTLYKWYIKVFCEHTNVCFEYVLIFYFHTGSTVGVMVLQEPQNSFTTVENKSLTMYCQHDDSNYVQMMWYTQQRNGGELKLLAFSFGKDNADIEKPFEKSKYTLTRPEV